MNSPSREIEWCNNLSYRCKNTQQYQKGTHGTKIDEANTKIGRAKSYFLLFNYIQLR
jgi:hypothetical protein